MMLQCIYGATMAVAVCGDQLETDARALRLDASMNSIKQNQNIKNMYKKCEESLGVEGHGHGHGHKHKKGSSASSFFKKPKNDETPKDEETPPKEEEKVELDIHELENLGSVDDTQLWEIYDLMMKNEKAQNSTNTWEGKPLGYKDSCTRILDHYKKKGMSLTQFNHQGVAKDALDNFLRLYNSKWNDEHNWQGVEIATHGSVWGPIGAFKAKTVYDAPPAYIGMQILQFDRRTKYDSSMKLGVVSREDAPYGRFLYAKMHAPFTDRDFHAQCFITRGRDPDTGENVLMIPCRQADGNDMKELDEALAERGIKPEGAVRAKYKAGGWIIRPVGNDKSSVSYLGSVDPAGWIPTPVVNSVMWRSGQLLKPFKDYVEKEYETYKSSKYANQPVAPDGERVDWQSELKNMGVVLFEALEKNKEEETSSWWR